MLEFSLAALPATSQSQTEIQNCITGRLQRSPSSSANVSRQHSSSSQDSLFPASLPIRLAPSFLHLTVSFHWSLCAFVNYTYLLS